MAPKIEPIWLDGFCREVQKQLRFNHTWACAFHTSWYTDEHHPMWDSIHDARKRREIRYGNNIYVLFRALLHCKKFYGQESFWAAIARGFNTSPTVARLTAEILAKARKEQRSKAVKDISDTARAADDWIDFLDTVDTRLRLLSDPEVYRVSEAFFRAQDKKHLDAAKVATASRQRSHSTTNRDRRSPERPLDGRNNTPIQSSPALHRKRSASPAEDVSSKSRRTDSDARQSSRIKRENHDVLDKPPTIQPTQSPPKVNRPRAAQPTQPAQPPPSSQPAQPIGSAQPTQTAPSVQPAPTNSVVAPSEPAKSKLSGQHVSQTPTSNLKEEPIPKAPTTPEAEDISELKARIASLEKQLGEAKNIQKHPIPPPSPSLPGQLGEDMVALKKEMSTATNAVSTMMESMHEIVDNLQLLQKEILVLAAEQKDLKTTLPQSAGNGNDGTKNPSFDLDAILQPLLNLDDKVNALRDEVSELKKRQAASSAPAASQSTGNDTKQLETLLKSHTARLDKLSQQMAALQQAQQQQQQQQQAQSQHRSPLSQGQPQNLRQAMAAAERDLKHHLATVQAFYHRGGASRAVTDHAADLLVTLSDAVRAAQAGQSGMS
ncbi:hypothetical protein VTH06DRAFT_5375 [Thermothelomyces fergusii]